MKTGGRLSIGFLFAAAVTAGIGALSQIRFSLATSDDAVLRLAWKNRSVWMEDCRKLTEDELLALPVHMRQERVCSGRLLSYRLRVSLDGSPWSERRIDPAGARGDRPIYVYEEQKVRPGIHRLSIDFERLDGVPPDPNVVPSDSPARLDLERDIELRPQEILLVTYDSESGRLVLEGPSSTPPMSP